jgi:hypothetical protein
MERCGFVTCWPDHAGFVPNEISPGVLSALLKRIPSVPTHEGRRSKRVMLKRFPCLVLDSSKEGVGLRGSFHRWRGQLVEVVLDSELFVSERCRVVWVGRVGSLGLPTRSAWYYKQRNDYKPIVL